MVKTECVLMWFRQDLRLQDNPALSAAIEQGRVLPIYILEDEDAGHWKIGAAKRIWLHHSLSSLSASLQDRLSIYLGRAEDILADLRERFDVKAVYWNRCYEPWRVSRDANLKKYLQNQGIDVFSYNGSLLWEPWEVLKSDKSPYRVFTPFYRKGCLNAAPPRPLINISLSTESIEDPESLSIDDLSLLPDKPWYKTIERSWTIGETGALKALDAFLEENLSGYREGRNFPSRPHVSRLSPYLQSGEISPHMVWHRAQMREPGEDLNHFCTELGWREFAYSLLFHFPHFPEKNYQDKFDNFPWQDNSDALRAWQRGQTGIPIVDAGMRELWQTGYMHNRVRMIVASFLTKNLRIDWRHGAAWFWDTLVDADLANNSAGWQWVAGSGVDAAPYFRIFNPVTQSERFDGDGDYIRRLVPEIKDLPDKFLFAPWNAPEEILSTAGLKLGVDYPLPLVDLKATRQQALDAYQSLKAN
ncbi:MAG: DNA photolyase family protein [Proteobacteria bacterium]|nr:DNA photolyase family protein [Pseudomonadota bacterium]